MKATSILCAWLPAAVLVLLTACGGGSSWINRPEPAGIAMTGTWERPTTEGYGITCAYPSGQDRVSTDLNWYTYSMTTFQVGTTVSGQLNITVYPILVPRPGAATYAISGAVGPWEGGEITRGTTDGWYPLQVTATLLSGNSGYYPVTLESQGSMLYGSGNLFLYLDGASDCTSPSRAGSRLRAVISGFGY